MATLTATQPVMLPAHLPALRSDLQLHPGSTASDGSPTWIIQDPVSNAFHRIGWLEFELLSRWALGGPQEIIAVTSQETVLKPTGHELAALYEYLLGHQLLEVHDARYTRYLLDRHRKGRLTHARWLLHHYLFFRVPLLHPQALLARMMPWLAWLFQPATAWCVLGLSGLGLLLTARQWDVFKASFTDTLTLSGLGGYLLALALTKSLHELGHALTATRYGLRVAHMGVAFVVMWPMLYTDTGESWRLHRSRQRLAIASAGVITELAIAGLATLGWNLAEDGSALKQALFFLASTAWLISLTLNISPFMRFDGYFILSDALDMPNLHERAGGLAKVAMRRTLLGWPDPDPEQLPGMKRRALIAFAYVTWVYRLLVFLGIAAAVYVYFFKLLGLFLFAVEIVWFVIRPIWSEGQVWWQRRQDVSSGHRWKLGLWGLGGLALAWLPWSHQIQAPAWAHPTRTHVLYSPLPARLTEGRFAAGAVKAGQTLFTLDQPELGYQSDASRSASLALARQLAGLGSEANGEEHRATLIQQQAVRDAEWQSHQDEASRLILKAPFDGVLVDVDPELAPGLWVTPRQSLGVVVDPTQWVAEAFVSQRDVTRLEVGDAVAFFPEFAGASAPWQGKVCQIDATRTATLPHAMLSSQHGGPISVLADASGLQPRDALYRVRVCLNATPGSLRVLRGTAVLEAQPHSWLLDQLKPAAVVLIRELGF